MAEKLGNERNVLEKKTRAQWRMLQLQYEVVLLFAKIR